MTDEPDDKQPQYARLNTDEYPDRASLSRWAEVLQVHPRTMLAHLIGKRNLTWAPYKDVNYTCDQVCQALNITNPFFLKQMLVGYDQCLTEKDLLGLLDISRTTFRARKYKPFISGHKFTRWGYKLILREHISRFVNERQKNHYSHRNNPVKKGTPID